VTVLGGNYEFEFVSSHFREDNDKVFFPAVVVQVLSYLIADCFLFFRGMIKKVFEGMVVVAEPVPEVFHLFFCFRFKVSGF
jgi:hypothetical protein